MHRVSIRIPPASHLFRENTHRSKNPSRTSAGLRRPSPALFRRQLLLSGVQELRRATVRSSFSPLTACSDGEAKQPHREPSFFLNFPARSSPSISSCHCCFVSGDQLLPRRRTSRSSASFRRTFFSGSFCGRPCCLYRRPPPAFFLPVSFLWLTHASVVRTLAEMYAYTCSTGFLPFLRCWNERCIFPVVSIFPANQICCGCIAAPTPPLYLAVERLKSFSSIGSCSTGKALVPLLSFPCFCGCFHAPATTTATRHSGHCGSGRWCAHIGGQMMSLGCCGFSFWVCNCYPWFYVIMWCYRVFPAISATTDHLDHGGRWWWLNAIPLMPYDCYSNVLSPLVKSWLLSSCNISYTILIRCRHILELSSGLFLTRLDTKSENPHSPET